LNIYLLFESYQLSAMTAKFLKTIIMSKLKIKPKQLIELGFPENPAISQTMSILEKEYKHKTFDEIVPLLRGLLKTPQNYWDDALWGKVAERILPRPKEENHIKLLEKPIPFTVFGEDHIEASAWTQMKTAARLPIAVSGALMPDAHSGYGLPIGGVLATEGAVIPYGVGVDIGCRMCLSVFPIPADDFKKNEKTFHKILVSNTVFGAGGEWGKTQNHAINEHPLFDEMPLLSQLHKKAVRQLGTSGSGNHFVEFGIAAFASDDAALGIKAGKYVALLSHSGSRGLGANIAGHFTRLAMDKRKLPQEAKHLAWLTLNEAEGAEYWAAMNLAGEYASACHDMIHKRISRDLGAITLAKVENHHNFAWKEMFNGREVIVHRKGATPAKKGEMGIIPGSMTAKGYIVRGRGEESALNSAAHGAGRKLSRSKAKASISHNALNEMLERHNVTLIGGGLDEAPHAYKDIELVMQSQQDLVDIVGTFEPRIVRMDGN
jgi:tRNA-splicing ligase RtcB (3'-phosphate/5'-hydroxy nucleic acid ligase)